MGRSDDPGVNLDTFVLHPVVNSLCGDAMGPLTILCVLAVMIRLTYRGSRFRRFGPPSKTCIAAYPVYT